MEYEFWLHEFRAIYFDRLKLPEFKYTSLHLVKSSTISPSLLGQLLLHGMMMSYWCHYPPSYYDYFFPLPPPPIKSENQDGKEWRAIDERDEIDNAVECDDRDYDIQL